MKKSMFALIVALVLCLTPLTALAAPINEEIAKLRESGKHSNETLNQGILNIEHVETGTITATVYEGPNEVATTQDVIVVAQPEAEASNKITRFVFELTNRYRPDTELALNVTQDTIRIYTMGALRDQAIRNSVNGVPEALANDPITEENRDAAWIDQYSPRTDNGGGGGYDDGGGEWPPPGGEPEPQQVKQNPEPVAGTISLDNTILTIQRLAYSLVPQWVIEFFNWRSQLSIIEQGQ